MSPLPALIRTNAAAGYRVEICALLSPGDWKVASGVVDRLWHGSDEERDLLARMVEGRVHRAAVRQLMVLHPSTERLAWPAAA